MSDCLSKEWLCKLKSVLKVNETVIETSLYYVDHYMSKKSNDPHPLQEDEKENLKSNKKKATSKLSAAQKSLGKANKTGMKSIKSFFSPK